MTLPNDENDFNTAQRKFYVLTVLQSFFAFYVATLALVVYFLYRDQHWVPTAIVLIALYIFILFASLKRVLDKLSLAALMLFIPIAPFAILVSLLSFIPIIQWLH